MSIRSAIGVLVCLLALSAAGDARGAVRITYPARSDGAQPIALTRYRDRQDGNAAGQFVTSQRELTVRARSDGPVRFTLATAGRARRVVVARDAPYDGHFDALAPGTYTLTAEELSGTGAVVGTPDVLRGVGVGDVIVTVGDSIVQQTFVNGQAALAVDNGVALSTQRDFGAILADELPFPTFIDNEGYGEQTSADYERILRTAAWRARVSALRPNKALVMLGTNDASAGRTGAQLVASLGVIVDALEARGIAPGSIVLSPPPFATKPLLGPKVTALQAPVHAFVRARGLVAGPDLYGLFRRHPDRISIDGIHPDTAAVFSMGRRWARTYLNSLR